jgi:hypothetical protein
VNWFSKQSAVMLAFLFVWYVIPKGPWTVVDAFGPSLFISDYTIDHKAWGVTSQFHTFVSHYLSAFLQVIRLMVLATRLIAVLNAGSWLTCYSFINPRLCFDSLSKPGNSLLRSESEFLLVDSLYTEDTETGKSQAAWSASSPELIWILGEINAETRLWNHSQSVNLSVGSERFLVVT